MNGTIARQMVDMLVESSSNVTMILKFFDMFLKLRDIVASDAFRDYVTDPRGLISKKDFQKVGGFLPQRAAMRESGGSGGVPIQHPLRGSGADGAPGEGGGGLGGGGWYGGDPEMGMGGGWGWVGRSRRSL